MNPFLEHLSARVDATAADLKSSLHSHVDSTVDSRLDTLKVELASLVRSAVVECIRTEGRYQHWRVNTTYTPFVSAHSQHSSGEVALMSVNHSTSFIEGIPPPLRNEFSAATTSQCIADVTFPSGHSVSIPLYNAQPTPHQLPPPSMHSSLLSNDNLDTTEQDNTSAQSAQTNNNQQINAEPFQTDNRGLLLPRASTSAAVSDGHPSTNSVSLVSPSNVSSPVRTVQLPNNCQNASTANESIDDGGANLSCDQHNTTTLNEPNEVTTVTQSAHLLSPQSSNAQDSSRSALNQQATVQPTQHNKRNQTTSKRSVKRSKKTLQNDDGGDGEDIANEEREEAKVKVLHLNCTESNCNVKLDSVAHLHDHLRTVHRIGPLQCFATNCKSRLDNSIQLHAHMQLHHSQDARFICAVCSKEYDSQKKANSHWYQNHQTGQFQCNFVSDCGQVSDTRLKMRIHHRAAHHSPSKHFDCTEPGCTASFAFKDRLKRHERTHLDTTPFHCSWPNCREQYNTRSNLVGHIRVQHFGLPRTMKKQKKRNIVDLRDPNEYVRVVV